ncbi:MAG: sulfatase-like hydrolase/transferase [Armatimonadota bacterium]
MVGIERCTRRDFLKGSSAVIAAMGVSSRVLGRSKEAQVGNGGPQMPPNILFLFSDQQRWDTLGCYGQSLPITPNLDRMAAEGTKFELAFTTQPVCGPARACIQTGKYPTETGNYRNGIPLPVGELTIADYLRKAGYEVGYIGKWHLAATGDRPVPPHLRGGYKDYWLGADALEHTSHGYDGHMFDADMKQVDFKGYRVDCQTDFVLEYLRTRDQKKPFFLFVSYLEPHFQNDHNHFEGPNGSKERFKNYEVPGDLKNLPGDWQEEFPDYLGCCWSIDQNIGRIRSELASLGLADNTLIIYTSDHGCHFRTRNGEYKRSCHESSIRIPMIAYGPGFNGGKVINELVSLIDIAPTILTAAGIKKPLYMRGLPLQDLVSGETENWPQEVFVQISESQTGRAIRTKRWKYSVSIPDASKPSSNTYYEDFLYDLQDDPHEQVNLIKDPSYASIRKELAEILRHSVRDVEGKEPEILPAV